MVYASRATSSAPRLS